MKLELADLQLFLSVVDAGSITQGAERVHLALASASERLRNMEDRVGVTLLERRPRGVVTTEAGEALAHHARLMLRQQDILQGELRDFALGAVGTLQLYANTAALTEFLPAKLASWLAERPRLHVELRERTSTEIVRIVAAGQADAGVVSSATETSGLQFYPVAKNHLVLIVPRNHQLACLRRVNFADVLGEPFIGLTAENALQEHIDSHARATGRRSVIRIRMKNFEGVCDMVAHGIGLGILPQSVAARYRRRFDYRIVALSDAWAQRQLCLCLRDWEGLPPPMRSLLAHLANRPDLAMVQHSMER